MEKKKSEILRQQFSWKGNKILTALLTTEDVQDFVSAIKLLLNSFYKTKGGKTRSTLNSLNRSLAKQVKDLTRSYPNNSEKIMALEEIKDKTLKLKIMKLTLSFQPSKNQILRMSKEVKEKLGENIILDINVDPSLLAGAIVVFEGIYKDLSARNGIENLLDLKREQIKKILYQKTPNKGALR